MQENYEEMCLTRRQHISAAPRIMQLMDLTHLGPDEIMHQSLDLGPKASLSSVEGRRIKGTRRKVRVLKLHYLCPCFHANLAAAPTPGD